MGFKRRRFKQTRSLEERLSETARRLREQAKLLPTGTKRDLILQRAEQAESAADMSEWLRLPAATDEYFSLDAMPRYYFDIQMVTHWPVTKRVCSCLTSAQSRWKLHDLWWT